MKNTTKPNIQSLLYYIDLLCEKIDLQSNAFMSRVHALQHGETEQADFIEYMEITPLNQQINYLAGKIQNLLP